MENDILWTFGQVVGSARTCSRGQPRTMAFPAWYIIPAYIIAESAVVLVINAASDANGDPYYNSGSLVSRVWFCAYLWLLTDHMVRRCLCKSF